MKTRTLKLSVSATILGFALAGCGGGSGSGSTANTPAVSKGVITALGSIFVNGVEYAVTGASVSVDKSSGIESDLRVGRVVTVHGSQSDDLHGSAASVEYKDNLDGPVDVAPDLVNKKFQALGQTVVVNTTAASVATGKTVFRNFSSLAQLTPNQVVEVSGIPDSTGVIQASYVEFKGQLTATTGIELKGTIANLDTTAKTFSIGALAVDYSTASLSNLTGAISNGAFVEVSGTGAGYTGGISPKLVASKVENDREDAGGTEGNNVSVEGFITGFNSGNTFKVGGQAVNTDTLSLAGLANNTRVEVEGTLSGGVLMVVKIKLH
jgi:hypothetical protein